MALQNTASEGVRVDKVWEVWKEANITTDWPPEEVKTIDTYRGSDHCLTFTNLSEIRGLMSTSFEELAYIEPGYELGERCPVLVYAPRTAAGRQAG